MSPPTVAVSPRTRAAFRHSALLYRGRREFLDATTAFIREGLHADEPVLVCVSEDKIADLRSALGRSAARVRFADMAELGRNPARIIPAWRDFVAEHSDRDGHLRGIGEPVWPGRSPDELAECHRHEALLNVAFDGGRPWWLLCPYDRGALDPAVIHDAHHSHPLVTDGTTTAASSAYHDDGLVDDPLAGALPSAPADAWRVAFASRADMGRVRALVAGQAEAAGLAADASSDLVLAVNEVATNSLRHGGGRGLLKVWAERGRLVCEVSDGGRIDHPLVGRERPRPLEPGGRGLWIVNQLCDLVQLRSTSDGTVVRMHQHI